MSGLGYWIGRVKASVKFRGRRLIRRLGAPDQHELGPLVQGVFQGVLGRRAERTAEDAFVAALANGDIDVAEMIRRLMALQEFERAIYKTSNLGKSIVQEAFRGVLGRDVEEHGLEMYANAMAHGLTLSGLIVELKGTGEFAKATGYVDRAGSPEALALSAALQHAESQLTTRIASDGVALQLGPVCFDHMSAGALEIRLRQVMNTLEMFSTVAERKASAALQ